MSESLNPTPIDVDQDIVRINNFSRYFIQPMLIAALASAMGSAFISILSLISPDLSWQIIRVILLVLVLEGVYTTLWLQQPSQRPLNKTAYRAAEITFFVVTLRFLTWWIAGNWPQVDNLISYLRNPVDSFLDPFFSVVLFVVIACWGWATILSSFFQEMALDPSEVRFYATPARDRPPFSLPHTPHRSIAFRHYGQHWLVGGVIISVFAALSTTDLTEVTRSGWPTINQLNLGPGMLASLLIYFGAGFMLLSQGRLALLNARWLFGGHEKTVAIEQNWVRQTAVVILAIGALAALFPIGSTNLIGRLIEIIIFYAIQIIGLAWLLIIFLLSLFVSPSDELPAEEELAEPLSMPEPVIPDVPPPPPAEPGFPIFGTIFWIVAIIVGLMALSFFIRERGIKLKMPNVGIFLNTIRTWWQALWRIAMHQITDFRDAIVTRLVRDEVSSDNTQPWRFIRLSSLNPRQKLRYFYLSTVQRADKREFARWESATPLEYAAELKSYLPNSSNEIEVVTDGFLRARYDHKEITTADVAVIEPLWKNLRSALKK
ncbi:MAG: DUF4129 domain-containing protein, partial [Chloroflexota bacterium]